MTTVRRLCRRNAPDWGRPTAESSAELIGEIQSKRRSSASDFALKKRMVALSLALLTAFGLCLLFCCIVYKGVNSGKVMAKSTTYRRDVKPIFFWILIFGYTLVASMCFAAMAVIAIGFITAKP